MTLSCDGELIFGGAHSRRNAAAGSWHRRWISFDPPSRAVWQLRAISRCWLESGKVHLIIWGLLFCEICIRAYHPQCRLSWISAFACHLIAIHPLNSPLIIYGANRFLCNTWCAQDAPPPPWLTNKPCPTGSLAGETCSLLCLPVGRLQPVARVEDDPGQGRQSCKFL